jgi:glycosyltransferase involved in cell wall biosynthesis
MNGSDVLVSVFCPVYNHEKYLRQCLDGIVMQKTNFQIEVFVQDDASTDNSPEIILEYAKKHDFIIPLLHKKNVFSTGESINNYFFEHAKGKYLAICEGDDYWTDPLKLQKQVDFLEQNEDFSICFHDVKILKDDKIVDDFIISPTEKEEFELEDFLIGNFMHTLSVMYRNSKEVVDYLNPINGNLLADFYMHAVFAAFGKIKRIDQVMAVYRFGSGVWSTDKNLLKKRRMGYHSHRAIAYTLNKNKKFINQWYKFLIEKNQPVVELGLDNETEFERFLLNVYSPENLAKCISFSNLLKIIQIKLYAKIKFF